jgi:hypothetical protein
MPPVGFEPAIPASERPLGSTLLNIPYSIYRGLSPFNITHNTSYTTDTREIILASVFEMRQEAALGN